MNISLRHIRKERKLTLISFEFVVFVIVFLLVYFKLSGKYQWISLLIASFIFYLCSDWRLVGYLLVTIFTQFYAAIKMDDLRLEFEHKSIYLQTIEETVFLKKMIKRKKRKWLFFSILINVGLLCVVKYTNFMTDSIYGLLAYLRGTENCFQRFNILIPLGISFYTFQSTGYIIDIYQGKDHAERNLLKFALFISFFPTIIQGPIERHSELAKQLYEPHKYDYNRFCFGLQRMLWGYIKKLVISERIRVLTSFVLENYKNNDYGFFILFPTILLSAIRVYTDFSGGMDIVIGFCEILDIKLTENFQRPFFATSISNFWQRWHITLGAWFKRYVFFSISLSKRFNTIVKKLKKRFGNTARYIPATLASLACFWIIGIWHGANWKYFFYGLYSAFWVATGTLFQDIYIKLKILFKIREEKFAWRLFQILRTIFLVTLGWFFPFAQNATDAFHMMKRAFTRFDPWVIFDGTYYTLGLNVKNFRFMIFSILILLVVDILNEKGIIIREKVSKQRLVVRWGFYYLALFFLIIFGMYGPGYNASDFVYMHF